MELAEIETKRFLPVIDRGSGGGFGWPVLRRENALEAVGTVNKILNAPRVAYARVRPDGEVDRFFYLRSSG